MSGKHYFISSSDSDLLSTKVTETVQVKSKISSWECLCVWGGGGGGKLLFRLD